MKTTKRSAKRKPHSGFSEREREQFRDIVAALAMTGTTTMAATTLARSVVRDAFDLADAWTEERDRRNAAFRAAKKET